MRPTIHAKGQKTKTIGEETNWNDNYCVLCLLQQEIWANAHETCENL